MPDGMKPVPSEGLSADKLIGATVFGADETKIGTVGDVLMTADGQTEAFVVDVGGFLGINSKPVAVSIANLDVATGKDDKMSVFTQFTKEQLQAQPAYSNAAYKRTRKARFFTEKRSKATIFAEACPAMLPHLPATYARALRC